ncbi:hypothetical protein G9A89_011579 [Geosiphon pyriformis]|nr:hypothetical protein G9A89_011579 [Geosiphon pyriformis]
MSFVNRGRSLFSLPCITPYYSFSSYLPYVYLSQLPYATALRLQENLVTRRLTARQLLKTGCSTVEAERYKRIASTDVLLLLQHPPTYTNGRRDRGKTAKAIEEARLRDMGAECFQTLRGGQTTFHGPGQLVGYPIFDLKNFKLSVRCYVAAIEHVIIETCAAYKINAGKTEHTGVWVGEEKICAIGIQIQRYITSHGFALNCNTDLDWFEYIVPCGLSNKKMTSITKEFGKSRNKTNGVNISVEDVLPVLCKKLGEVFGRELKALETIPDEMVGGLNKVLDEILVAQK